MNITTLDFEQILNWFHNQSQYDFMILFASNYDYQDKEIIHKITENAKRIDRITSKKICYIYFIEETSGHMDHNLTRLPIQPIHQPGILPLARTAFSIKSSDDVCKHFDIRRSFLPAFILISKDEKKTPQLLSIQNYDDFEGFLSTLIILHDYIDDKDIIESKLRSLVTSNTSKQNTDAQEELEKIRQIAIDKLNRTMAIHDGEHIIDLLHDEEGYSEAVLEAWGRIKSHDLRIDNILEEIRHKISQQAYDVFISCKYQDYDQAMEVFEFLQEIGYKPFLADPSLKDIGHSQATTVIGEVINICPNMVVFTTDARYLETSYVHAEWLTFIHDINTGHRSNSSLIIVLAPDVDIHSLPQWLRDKQCCTTENYKNMLPFFLKNECREEREQYREEIHRLRDEILHFQPTASGNIPERTMIKMWEEIQTVEKAIDSVQSIEDMERLKSRMYLLRRRVADFRNVMETLIREREIRYSIDYDRPAPQAIPPFDEDCGTQEDECDCSIERDKRENDMQKDDQSGQDVATYDPTPPKPSDSGNVNESVSERASAGGGLFGGIFSSIGLLGGAIVGAFAGVTDIFGKERKSNDTREEYQTVFSSVFAPAKAKRKSHVIIQVFLHLYEETDMVIALAPESQKDTERRGYIPLSTQLKRGDTVDVLLNIYGEALLMSEKKRLVWQGHFTKCNFDFLVPDNPEVKELSCKALLMVNNIPVGEMNFVTSIVTTPEKQNTNVFTHKYKKVFISYAHQDITRARDFAMAYKAQGIDYFFDRHNLDGGVVYEEVIYENLDSSDLFFLCWSANAAKSENVLKERTRAMKRAYPQVSKEEATINIYPVSIEPRTDLPEDMAKIYNFEII